MYGNSVPSTTALKQALRQQSEGEEAELSRAALAPGAAGMRALKYGGCEKEDGREDVMACGW